MRDEKEGGEKGEGGWEVSMNEGGREGRTEGGRDGGSDGGH